MAYATAPVAYDAGTKTVSLLAGDGLGVDMAGNLIVSAVDTSIVTTTTSYTNFLTDPGGGDLSVALQGIDTALTTALGYTVPEMSDTVRGGAKVGPGVWVYDGKIRTAFRTDDPGLSDVYQFKDVVAWNGKLYQCNNVNGTGGPPSEPVTSAQWTLILSRDYGDLTSVPSTFAPSAHKTSHATGGSDALSPSDIGAAAVSHAHSASDVTSGTFDIARIPTGTTSTTVSLGNHTHSQLHDRSHAITSTSDHTAGNWRLFHSNGSGQVVELAFGNSGQALISNGASAAPSWGSAGSNSASDLTVGTLAYARMADPTVTSPSQITSSQNDYASFARGINRFSTNGAYNLTGMVAGSDGEVRVLCNTGTTAANTLTLKDESASSTAANRFYVPWNGDCVIPAEGSVVVFYDNTSSRWRVV